MKAETPPGDTGGVILGRGSQYGLPAAAAAATTTASTAACIKQSLISARIEVPHVIHRRVVLARKRRHVIQMIAARLPLGEKALALVVAIAPIAARVTKAAADNLDFIDI